MIKRLFALVGTLLIVFTAQGIDGRFDVKAFYAPSEGSYAETHLSINARGVTFKNMQKQQLGATVIVQYLFFKGNEIVKADKFKLNSPLIDSISQATFLFTDVQRFLLSNGKYNIEVKIVDAFDTSNLVTLNKSFEIADFSSTTKPIFSDLMFVAKHQKTEQKNQFSRHGLDLIPYSSSFFPETIDTIKTFFEVYGLSNYTKDSILIVRTYLAPDNHQEAVFESNRYHKISTKKPGIIFDIKPISNLPTGSYRYIAQIISKLGDTLAQIEKPIQRLKSGLTFQSERIASISTHNSFVQNLTDIEAVEAAKSVRPIADMREKEFLDRLVKEKPLNHDLIRKYLIAFWERRDAQNPKAAFEKYQSEVAYAQTVFGTRLMRGHETDRGRVILQYGKPDSRTVMENEPSALPYEIWWYYQLGNQSNVRFVFYAQSLAINDYQLLHSEAFGEPNNPNWRLFIFKRTTPFNNIDEENNRGHYGSQVDPYFRNN